MTGSWDFKTEDKIVFWTSVGAVSFLIVVVIAVVLAYFCCYKKRKESEDRYAQHFTTLTHYTTIIVLYMDV